MFYVENKPENPLIWLDSSLNNNQGDRRYYTSFNLTEAHTVGVGVDIENSVIWVFYEGRFANISYTPFPKGSRYSPYIGGGYITNCHDIISVNFGNLPFSYKFGGFRKWSETNLICTKQMAKTSPSTSFLFRLLLIQRFD